jgi:hypothetical protein
MPQIARNALIVVTRGFSICGGTEIQIEGTIVVRENSYIMISWMSSCRASKSCQGAQFCRGFFTTIAMSGLRSMELHDTDIP